MLVKDHFDNLDREKIFKLVLFVGIVSDILYYSININRMFSFWFYLDRSITIIQCTFSFHLEITSPAVIVDALGLLTNNHGKQND